MTKCAQPGGRRALIPSILTQLDRVFEPRSSRWSATRPRPRFGWLLRFKDFRRGPVLGAHQPEFDQCDHSRRLASPITGARSPMVPRPLDYVARQQPGPRRYLRSRVFTSASRPTSAAPVAYFTSGFAGDRRRRLRPAGRDRPTVPASRVWCCSDHQLHGRVQPSPQTLPSSAGMPLGEAGPRGDVEPERGRTPGFFFARALFRLARVAEKSRRGWLSGFGNGSGLDAADLVEYLGDDDHVSVLAAYLEGHSARPTPVTTSASPADLARAVGGPRSRQIIWERGRHRRRRPGSRPTTTGSAPVHSGKAWGRILATNRSDIGVKLDGRNSSTPTATIVKLGRLRGSASGPAGPHRRAGPSHHRHLRPSRPEASPPLTQPSLDEARHVLRIRSAAVTATQPSIAALRPHRDTGDARPAILRRASTADPERRLRRHGLLPAWSCSAHRVQNDYGVGQRHPSRELPDAGGERFHRRHRRSCQRATKPFFAIVSPAETEQEGLELRAVLRDAGILGVRLRRACAAAYSNAPRRLGTTKVATRNRDGSAHQLKSARGSCGVYTTVPVSCHRVLRG